MGNSDVLVRRDAGGGALSEKLRELGFAAEHVVCTSRLRVLLAGGDPSAKTGRLAVLVGTELPEPVLAETLEALAEPLAQGCATGVIVGPRVSDAALARFSQAGFGLSLHEPFGDHALRFQVNRAFLHRRAAGAARCELRAPLDWNVSIRVGRRSKSAALYNLSEGGAYLETPRPSLRGVQLSLELTLPMGTRSLNATVVHTNVPGNMSRRRTPYGMGICFEGLTPALAHELGALVTQHAQTLVV